MQTQMPISLRRVVVEVLVAAEVILVARDARDDRLVAQASRAVVRLRCVAVDGEALVVQVQVVVDLPWQQLLLGRGSAVDAGETYGHHREVRRLRAARRVCADTTSNSERGWGWVSQQWVSTDS